MNINLECNGYVYKFLDVSDLEDLKQRLIYTEPQFLLDSLTYIDEDQDVISICNNEDFSCLSESVTIIAAGQNDSQFNEEKDLNIKQKQERLIQKINHFKDITKSNIVKRKDLYQSKLNLIQEEKKKFRDQKLQEKVFQLGIDSLKLQVKEINKTKIKKTLLEDLQQTEFFIDLKKIESIINYEEPNWDQFKKTTIQIKEQLTQKFVESYKIRLNKFIGLRQKKELAYDKLEKSNLQLQELKIQNKRRLLYFKAEWNQRFVEENELQIIMKIEVHIKDKQFSINCGDGLQKVKWLGDVAILRHSHFYTQINSTTQGVKLENGDMVDLNAIISSTLADNTHVWVILKEDLEAIGAEQKGSMKRPMTAISRKK